MAWATGNDIEKYVAYCDVMISLNNIESGTNLTEIYNAINSLNNFNDAKQLFYEDSYMKQIKAIEGVWICKNPSSFLERKIEISDGVLHDSYYYDYDWKTYEPDWKTYENDIYAYSGKLYAGSIVNPAEEHYDLYDIVVNGSTIVWREETYKK